MQVPIINGIYADADGRYRTALPRNLVPVPKKQGINNGYLRPAEGIVQTGAYSHTGGNEICRGGINWNGSCFRVMGKHLIEVYEDGIIKDHGVISGSNHVTFDYSFDYLSISSEPSFYLFDGTTLKPVATAPSNLGPVVDHIWVDGYFMTTDGESLVVTNLTDPFTTNPLKYGSSELDPDPVKALLKVNNEPYAINRYTIEVFNNVGGSGFPFRRVNGAQIEKGTVGTKACCKFAGGVAFIGGGRGESISVWLGARGQVGKVATEEIDTLLNEYSEETLSNVFTETRVFDGHEQLLIHLPNKTLVYDHSATRMLGQKVWFELSSSVGDGKYRARYLVYCYNKWLVADTENGALGELTRDTGDHWGSVVDWQITTPIIYADGAGAIFHEIELIGLPGNQTDEKVHPRISTQYSVDGVTWSQPKTINMKGPGNRNKKLVWFNQGMMRDYRIQRFQGDSSARLSIARLDVRLEALSS